MGIYVFPPAVCSWFVIGLLYRCSIKWCWILPLLSWHNWKRLATTARRLTEIQACSYYYVSFANYCGILWFSFREESKNYMFEILTLLQLKRSIHFIWRFFCEADNSQQIGTSFFEPSIKEECSLCNLVLNKMMKRKRWWKAERLCGQGIVHYVLLFSKPLFAFVGQRQYIVIQCTSSYCGVQRSVS